MSFLIKVPYVISTHIKKFSSTGSLVNKNKAAAFGVVNNIPYFHDGTAARQIVDVNTAATLLNKTISGGTIGGAISSDVKFCSTQFDAVTGTTGTTLTDVVGLTGFSLVAGASYRFHIHIAGVSTANSGMKIGMAYQTLTATSIESMARGFTAAAVAVQHSTTSTSGMSLYAQTAAVINVTIEGRLVVNAAGTLSIQAAQNAAHVDTTSVYVGSFAEFTRIA